MEEGRRLPSVRDIAAEMQVSIGSASKALTSLETVGAVTISRRGHLGSFVEERSLGDLWAIGEQEPLVIAMTLPSNPRFEGLATALKMVPTRAGVRSYIICIRGAAQRLHALREYRCHVAAMSRLAAEALCSETEQVVLRLPAGSWVWDHRIYSRHIPSQSPHRLRVAIDRTSPDHERLTELAFAGNEVEFSQTSAWQIPRLLADGRVDAALWDSDDMDAHPGHQCMSQPLPQSIRSVIGDTDTTAVLVVRRESVSVSAILRTLFHSGEIMDIQRMVIDGEMVPEF